MDRVPATLHRKSLYRRVEFGLIAVAVACVAGGCGQAARSGEQRVAQRTSVATARPVVVAGTAVPARVVAKVVARERSVQKTAARLQREAAAVVARDDRTDAHRHRPAVASASARSRASVRAKALVAVRSPAAVRVCVDRARARLLKSLGKRFPSAGQIDAVLRKCVE